MDYHVEKSVRNEVAKVAYFLYISRYGNEFALYNVFWMLEGLFVSKSISVIAKPGEKASL